jgi:hypothetical protein
MCAVLVGACGSVTKVAAAKVGQTDITQATLDGEVADMLANKQYTAFLEQQGTTIRGSGQGAVDLGFVTRVLTRQIYLDLVHQEVVRRKLQPTASDLQFVQSQVEQEVGGAPIFNAFSKSYRSTLLRRDAEIAGLQLALSGVKVDTAAMRDFYDKNADQFSETCVSHILFAAIGANGQVDTTATAAQSAALQAQAAAAKARIDGGADFAAVAKELSQDTSNAGAGGDLQCGGPGRFVPQFEQAMDALQPGQVSSPVQTQFGWHLIKVTKRAPQPFEAVTDQIRQQLLGQAQSSFGPFVQETLAKTTITINPRYGTFSKSGQSPGVVPPTPPTTRDVGGASSKGSGGATPSPIPQLAPQQTPTPSQ